MTVFKLYIYLMHCKNIFFIFLFFSVLFPLNSLAKDTFDFDTSVNTQEQWKLTADSLATLDNGAIIEAQGDVILQRGNDIIKADFARYYTATDWIFIRENVYIKLGKDELLASEAEFNIETATGFLQEGKIFMAEQHIYFTGEYVKKYSNDTYTFEYATITTCDPNDPVWNLRAEKADIEIDGYANLSFVQFELGPVASPPIPSMVIPAKRTRQTGLLKPDFGYSTLHGNYYSQPWFWAINDMHDLTFTPGYFAESGTMLSGEYRSHTGINSKTWLTFDYLFAEQPYIQYSSTYSEDDRYWLRGMTDGKIFNTTWEYKLNVDYVSDPYFLRDYQFTLTGFDNSLDDSYAFLGREFRGLYQNRVSEGYIHKNWTNTLLTVGFQYTQNPYYGTLYLTEYDTTVQKLPEVNLYLMPIIFSDNLPLQFDNYAHTSYSYRRYGTSGMRTELTPRISIPFEMNAISFLTQGSVQNRTYFATTDSITNTSLNNEISTILNLKTQAAIQASRIWFMNQDTPLEPTAENINKSQTIAFRHLMEPRVTYSFVEEMDQGNLPYYSQADRVYGKNEISLSLHNIFTAKEERVRKVNNVNTKNTSFRNIATLTISASYDFREAERTDFIEMYPSQPFSDIHTDLNFYLFGLNLKSQIDTSVYGDGVTRFDISTNIPFFALSEYLSLRTGFSYRHYMYDYQNIVRYASSIDDIDFTDEVKLLTNVLTFKPTKNLSFHAEYDINLLQEDIYEIIARATYTHQCYILSFNYNYTPYEKIYGFKITLPGIFN